MDKKVNVLFRYISSHFIKLFLICIVSFLLVYLTIDVMSMSWKLRARGVPLADIGKYFLFKIPLILAQITPMATLLATMLTLGILSKNSEITVIKSCGISIYAISTPILLLCLLISLFSIATNEYLVPFTNKRYKEIEQYRPGSKSGQWLFKRNKIWYFGGKNVYNIDSIDVDKKSLNGVTVFYMGKGYNVEKRVDAERASFNGREWVFQKGVIRSFTDSIDVEQFDEKTFEFDEKYDDFIIKVAKRLPDEMNFEELNRHIEKLKKMGMNYSRFFVDLMAKVAFPLANLILPLIGIPFALKSGRSAGIASGVGISIVIGFIYWITMAFNVSLGHAGILTPFLAAFGSNIVFGLAGIVMILNAET